MPSVHETVFNKSVESIFQLGVTKKLNRLESGARTFIQPKNDETVRLLSNLENQIKEYVENCSQSLNNNICC